MSNARGQVTASRNASASSSHKGHKVDHKNHQLTSDLFAGDNVLRKLAAGQIQFIYSNEYGEAPNGSKFALKLQQGLKIVLGIDDNTWPEIMHFKMTPEFFQHIRQFQNLKNGSGKYLYPELPKPVTDEQTVLDSLTIKRLDAELNAIFFYDIRSSTVIHDARHSKYVGAYTAAIHNCTLKDRPDINSRDVSPGGYTENINKYDSVFLIQILKDKKWFWVETSSGLQGYLHKNSLYLDDPMPDPQSKLLEVKSSSTSELRKALRAHLNLSTTDNLQAFKVKLYILLTLRLNNPDGRSTRKFNRLNLNSGLYEEAISLESANIYFDDPTKHNWDPFKEIYKEGATETEFGQDPNDSTKFNNVFTKSWEVYHNYLNNFNIAAKIKVRASFIWLPSLDFFEVLWKQFEVGADNVNALQKFKDLLANNNIGVAIQNKLDDHWPDSFGLRINAAVGATFGIPLGIDGDFYFAIWREGDNIKVIRRGSLAGAFDTGIGAGAFIGGSDQGKLYGRDQNHLGLHAQAVAQFKAGIKILVHQELEFPIFDNFSIASLLLMILEMPSKTQPNVNHTAQIFLEYLKKFGIDPNSYTKMIKLDGGLFVNANATAGAGAAFGGQQKFKEYWKNDSKKHGIQKGITWNVWSLATLFSMQLGIGGSVTASLGIKVSFDKFDIDPETGFRIPGETEFELYADGEASISGDIPVFTRLFPFLSSLTLGGGIRLVGKIDNTQDLFANDPNKKNGFRFHKLAVYTKAGDTDVYLGPASEMEFELETNFDFLKPSISGGSISFELKPLTIQSFVKNFKIQKVMGANQIFSSMFTKSFFANKENFNIGLGHTDAAKLRSFKGLYDSTKIGLNALMLVDFAFSPPIDKVTDFFKSLYTDLKPNLDNIDWSQSINEDQLLEILKLAFKNLNPQTMNSKYRTKLLGIIEDCSPKIKFHGELGIQTGLGFQIAELAKARIRLTVGANAVIHKDITHNIVTHFKKVTFGDVSSYKELLRKAFLTKIDVNQASEVILKPTFNPPGVAQ